jgi:SAM-dependent MidA family methyltransferase
VGGFYVGSSLSLYIKWCFESLSCNRRRVGHLVKFGDLMDLQLHGNSFSYYSSTQNQSAG